MKWQKTLLVTCGINDRPRFYFLIYLFTLFVSLVQNKGTDANKNDLP